MSLIDITKMYYIVLLSLPDTTCFYIFIRYLSIFHYFVYFTIYLLVIFLLISFRLHIFFLLFFSLVKYYWKYMHTKHEINQKLKLQKFQESSKQVAFWNSLWSPISSKLSIVSEADRLWGSDTSDAGASSLISLLHHNWQKREKNL